MLYITINIVNMIIMEYTTISISKTTKKRLNNYVATFKGETYDQMINRLLDIINGKEK